jgi:hypothetical protein
VELGQERERVVSLVASPLLQVFRFKSSRDASSRRLTLSLRREKEGNVPSVMVILRIRPLYETLTVKPGMVERRAEKKEID